MAKKKAKKNKKPAMLKDSIKPGDKPTDAQRRVFKDIAGKALPRSVKTVEQAQEAIRLVHFKKTKEKAKKAKEYKPDFQDNAVFLHVEKPVESDCGLGKTDRCPTCGTEVHRWTDGSLRPDPAATAGNIKRLQNTISSLRDDYDRASDRADEQLREYNKIAAKLRQTQADMDNLKGALEFYIRGGK